MPSEPTDFGNWLFSFLGCRFCQRPFKFPGKQAKCPHCDNEELSSHQRFIIGMMAGTVICALIFGVLLIIGHQRPLQSGQALEQSARRQSDK